MLAGAALLLAACGSASEPEAPPPDVQAKAIEMPQVAAFVRNQGQFPKEVLYAYMAQYLAIGAVPGGLLLSTQVEEEGHVLRLGFGNPTSMAVAEKRLPGVVNYFLGGGTKAEVQGLERYAAIRFVEAWPGVDVVYAMEPDQLKSVIHAEAGADVSALDMTIQGANAVEVTADGSLVITDRFGSWSDSAPVAWQDTPAGRSDVAVSYEKLAADLVRLQVGAHDPAFPLVIDPTLRYATLLGGAASDLLSVVATVRGRLLDPLRTFVVAGTTSSASLLAVGGPFGPVTRAGYSGNGLVAKYTYPPGSGPAGAPPRDEWISVFLAGLTPEGVALAPSGNVALAGLAVASGTPLSASPGALQPGFSGGTFDGFALRLDASGTTVLAATYLGGSNNDLIRCLAMGPDESMYLGGYTYSLDFPVTSNAFQNFLHNDDTEFTDGVVAHVSADGTSLLYSTYIGGSGFDKIFGIDLDDDEFIYVCGSTTSRTIPYPTTDGAHKLRIDGIRDGFVTRFKPTGDVDWSTVLGGGDLDTCWGIRVAPPEDGEGPGGASFIPATAYVVGETDSDDFPTTAGAYDSTFAGTPHPILPAEGFVTRLRYDGQELMYSSYIGGNKFDLAVNIEVDENQFMYITGATDSPDWVDGDPSRSLAGFFLLKLHWMEPRPRYFRFVTDGRDGTCVRKGLVPDVAVLRSELALLAGQTFGRLLPLLGESPIPPRDPVAEGADGFMAIFDTR